MRKLFLQLFLLLLMCLGSLYAQEINSIAIGTRPAALGNTFTALANDANTVFYNAAGSVYLQKSELTFQNIFFKNGLNSFNFLSFSQVLAQYGTLNIGLIKNSLPHSTGSLNLINTGYGYPVFWFLAAGINLKYYNQTVEHHYNNTFDMDVNVYIDPTINKKKEIKELIAKLKKYMRKNSNALLESGKQAFSQKKYIEAINYFSESLKFDPNNADTRDYLKRAGQITGLHVNLPPAVQIKSEPLQGDFSMHEREILAEKEYQRGLENYYNGNYILALRSWQKALDILYINYTVDRMKLGFSVKNLLKHKYYQNEILHTNPLQFHAGLAYAVIDTLNIIAEFYKSEGESNKLGISAGLELTLWDFLALRTGLKFGTPITFQNKQNEYTAGLGVHYKNYFFDYAFEPNNSLYNHSISVSIQFGESKEEEAIRHLNQGILYAKSSQLEDAKKEWRTALLLDPAQIMARKYLNGEVNVTQTLMTNKENDLSYILTLKGIHYFTNKDYINARAHFSEALIINSQNTQAQHYLNNTETTITNLITDFFIQGKDQIKRQEWEQAVYSFEEILKLDPKNMEAKQWLSKAKINFQTILISKKNDAILLYQKAQYQESLDLINYYLKYEPADKEAREYQYKITQALEKEARFNQCLQLYDSGITFLSNKNYIKAQAVFLEVKQLDLHFKDINEKIKFAEEKIKLEQERQAKIQQAQNLYNDAIAYFQAGNYQAAKDSFQQALSYNPGLSEAQTYLKETDNKIIMLMEEKDKKKKSDDLYAESMELIKKEKYSAAIDKLTEALRMQPDDKRIKDKSAECKNLLRIKVEKPYQDGILFFNQGQLSKAIERWNYVLSIQPDHALAKTFLETAIQQKNESIRVHNNLAEQYVLNKDYSNALKEYREVLALDPDNKTASQGADKLIDLLKEKIEAIYKKGKEYFNNKKYDLAQIEFQSILNIDPGHIASQEYLKKCDEHIKEQSKNAQIAYHLIRGREYFKNRFFEEAKHEFLKILALDPENSESKKLLAETENKIRETQNKDKISELFNKVARYYRDDDFEHALQLLKEINKIDPDNELIKKYIFVTQIKWDNYCDEYYSKAKTMQEQGDFITAKNFYQKVHKSNPRYKDVELILERFDSSIKDYVAQTKKQALELYNSKNYADSYILWDKIHKLNPDDLDVKHYVKLSAGKSEIITKARELFTQAISLFRDNKWLEAEINFNNALLLNPSLKNEYDKNYKAVIQKNITPALNTILNEGIKNYDKTDYLKARDYLTVIYHVAPENERAKKYFHDVNAKITDTAQTHFNEAKNHYKKNNLKSAYDEIMTAIQFSPANESMRNLYQEIDEKYSSQRIAKERRNKDNVDTLLFEGIRLYRAGDLKNAIDRWKKVLALDPDNSSVKNYLERAQTKLRKLSGQ